MILFFFVTNGTGIDDETSTVARIDGVIIVDDESSISAVAVSVAVRASNFDSVDDTNDCEDTTVATGSGSDDGDSIRLVIVGDKVDELVGSRIGSARLFFRLSNLDICDNDGRGVGNGVEARRLSRSPAFSLLAMPRNVSSAKPSSHRLMKMGKDMIMGKDIIIFAHEICFISSFPFLNFLCNFNHYRGVFVARAHLPLFLSLHVKG